MELERRLLGVAHGTQEFPGREHQPPQAGGQDPAKSKHTVSPESYREMRKGWPQAGAGVKSRKKRKKKTKASTKAKAKRKTRPRAKR